MGRILELLEEKKKVIGRLEGVLSRESIEIASKDHHSKRRPRPCGITIHTGIGCSNACYYCYIYDMGFTTKVRPYPLTALELVYALAKNPYVVPRRTFAAYGSVTEPFLLETRGKALEYIANVYKWLYLPSQVSTKMVIDDEISRRLKNSEPNISILVTLITLGKSGELEPLAPRPLERLSGIRTASRYGLPVYLFVRPMIPGITDKELDTIMKLGAELKVRGVVLGSLRITNSIIQRLWGRGVDLNEILRRATKKPEGRKQVPIKSGDLIKLAEKIADDHGLRVFRSACMANIDAHRDYCCMCSLGPCGDRGSQYTVEYGDIAEYLEYIGLKFVSIEVGARSIDIKLRGSVNLIKLDIAKTVLTYASRKTTFIKPC